MYQKIHRWSDEDEVILPETDESQDGRQERYDADVEELGGHSRQIIRDDE